MMKQVVLASIPCLLLCLSARGFSQSAIVETEGILILSDGRRLFGEVLRTQDGYKVRKGRMEKGGWTLVRNRTFPDGEVRKWKPRSELLAEFRSLAARMGRETPYVLCQLGIWAFENALLAEGWTLFAELLPQGKAIAGWSRLEEAAAWALCREYRPGTTAERAGRRMLLAMARPRGRPIRLARNRVTGVALRILLEEEARSLAKEGRGKKKKAAVLTLCRKFAEDALDPGRRREARRALMDFDPRSRRFVYRLAVRYPEGPNRRAILSQIRSKKLADEASTYLSRQLVKNESFLVKMRTARVLGSLGSPKALPALKKTLEAVTELEKDLRRRGGTSGGATRAYVAFYTQHSYIRDFNVEVAQAAAVADPQVDVIQHGVVLDATVLGVQWTRYIFPLQASLIRAIRALER